jgi:hypothetical protein
VATGDRQWLLKTHAGSAAQASLQQLTGLDVPQWNVAHHVVADLDPAEALSATSQAQQAAGGCSDAHLSLLQWSITLRERALT